MKYFNLIGLIAAVSLAAAPETLWTRNYGSYNDFGFSIEQISDGGYIVTGYSDPRQHADSFDVFLLRIDSAGGQKWFRTYFQPGWECGYQALETPDHNYIVVGITRSAGAGGADVYLFKSDTSGKQIWTKTYGGPKDDAGTSIDITSDNGYIIGGHTWSFSERADFYLIRTNAMGDTIWTKTYGGANDDIGNSVKQTYDDGFIMVGHSNSFRGNPDSFVIYLVKTDTKGETLWTRTFPYNESRWGHGFFVQQTTDRGYIIAGSTWPSNERKHDLLLIKTDEKGKLLWQKTFGDTNNDVGKGVEQTADGGYIATGYTSTQGMFYARAWLLKTDNKGDSVWAETFPGKGQSWSFSVQQTSDYGYVITGKSYPGNVFVVKTGPDLTVQEKPRKKRSCLIPFFR